MRLFELDQKSKDKELSSIMQQHYDKFNRLYFDSKLPKIPISFKRLKGIGAKVTFRVRRAQGTESLVPGSLEMKFNNAWNKTIDDYDLILLHEMIHVWFAAVEIDYREVHGRKFMTKLREISVASGLDIPLTETETDREYILPPKPIIVAILDGADPNNACFALLSPNIFNDPYNLTSFRSYVMRLRIKTLEVYYIDNSTFWTGMSMRAPVQRKIVCKFFILKNQEGYRELITNGQEILKFKKL